MDNKTTMTKDMFNKAVAEAVAEATKGLNGTVESLNATVADLNAQVSRKELTKQEKAQRFAALASANITALNEVAKGHAMPAGGKTERVMQIIEQEYGKSNPDFVKEVQRQKDLMASGNGGNLIETTHADGFLDLLWDETLLGKIGVNFLPTETGNLTISKVVEGVSAGYVSELGSAPSSTAKFGTITLSVKKLMARVPISNDLIRFSRLDVQGMIIDLIRKEMVRAQDATFLYGKGGQWEPRGIANVKDVKVLPKASAGLLLTDDMKAELGKNNISLDSAHFVMGWGTYLALIQETLPDVGFVNRTEMANGRINGIPYTVTNRISATNDGTDDVEDLFLIATNHVTAIQKSTVQIDVSPHASFATEDGTVMSAFDSDFTAVRGIVHNDFGLDYKSAAIIAKVKVSK